MPILRYISRCVQTVNRFAIKCHIAKPAVVVVIDGGICSQMHAYLRGQYYAQEGISVYYDLRWFEISGMDNDGKYERPFELIHAFPDLEFQQMSKVRNVFYRLFLKCDYENNLLPDRTTIRQSLYVALYPEFRDDKDYADLFHRCFNMQYAKSSKHLNVPEGSVPCAIHVRRGDMSYVDFCGYDNPAGYFVDAVNYVTNKYGKVKFFLFSDEPDWAKAHLLPLMKDTKSIETITGNKGYEDLLLAAQCSVIIASQGTMGRMAGLLNEDAELFIPPTGDWGSYHVEKYRKVTQFPLPKMTK